VKRSEMIVSALLTMALGVLLIVLRARFISIVLTVAGVCLIALGVVDLFYKRVPPSVIKIVSGVLIIVCGWMVVSAVLYVIAAVLLVCGILLLYDKIRSCVRGVNLFYTICEYAAPCVAIIIGFLLLFNQSRMINVIFIISGILTAIEGVLLLVNALSQD